MNPTNETRPCENRTPAPTENDSKRTRPCHGTIQRRTYIPDYWYIENCDTCNIITTGFLDPPTETAKPVHYGSWSK